jgi:hypothetical protein
MPRGTHQHSADTPARVPQQSTARDIALERHYTVPEISKLWHLDKNTVRRLFADEPGIVCFGSDERRHRRRYMSFRVPESVVLRVHRKLRQGSTG